MGDVRCCAITSRVLIDLQRVDHERELRSSVKQHGTDRVASDQNACGSQLLDLVPQVERRQHFQLGGGYRKLRGQSGVAYVANANQVSQAAPLPIDHRARPLVRRDILQVAASAGQTAQGLLGVPPGFLEFLERLWDDLPTSAYMCYGDIPLATNRRREYCPARVSVTWRGRSSRPCVDSHARGRRFKSCAAHQPKKRLARDWAHVRFCRVLSSSWSGA